MKKFLTIVTLALSLLAVTPAGADAVTVPYHCTLRASVVSRQGGMSHEYETVQFVNTAHTVCVFKGYPVLLGYVAGKRVPLDVIHTGAAYHRLYVAPGHAFLVDLTTLTAYSSPVVSLSLVADIHARHYGAGALLASTPGSAYPVYESPARPRYEVAPTPPPTHKIY